MRDVFAALPGALAKIDPDKSYLRSYPVLIKHFRDIETFDADTFVVAAHVVYGWMPTILNLEIKGYGDLKRAASALNRARRENFDDEDLRRLIPIVNNSLVGASKLLHFASPEKFAILDSKVYRFIFEKEPYHKRMINIRDFSEYHAKLVLQRHKRT